MGGYSGIASLADGSGQYGTMEFIVRSIMGRMSTCTLVQIKAVDLTNPNDPRVDINPLVSQIDGDGKGTPHGIIHNVPCMRIQGGAYAVIVTPAVGDIGIAVFASRDISTVKKTGAPSLPGSRRSYDWADALYLGAVLNPAPTSYVKIDASGIELHATTSKSSGVFKAGNGVGGTVTAGGHTLTFADGILTGFS